jgi:hypothetical protein
MGGIIDEMDWNPRVGFDPEPAKPAEGTLTRSGSDPKGEERSDE